MSQAYATIDDLPSEFESVSLGDREFWLEVCQAYVSLEVWGAKASTAHMLLTSHKLKLLGLGTGPAGRPVQSRSVGDVSVTFQPAFPKEAELATTIYGQTYLDLRDALRVGPIAVRSSLAVSLER